MELQAILFDRDGTVIFDRHYLSDPSGVELIPGTGGAVAELNAAGVDAFIVSNQSGIGRGYFPESGWHACMDRLAVLLAEEGAVLRDARFCPHAPEEACACRKPAVGMWTGLRDAWGLDPLRCAMVGDKREDVEMGINAGLAASVLVMTGKGAASAEKYGIRSEEVAAAGFMRIPGAGNGVTAVYAAADAAAAVRGLLGIR